MQKKIAPAEVALGSGAGLGKQVAPPDHSNNHANAPDSRPVFVLRLEPLPGIDGRNALRELLKRAHRNHGLRCLACREEAAPTSGMSHEEFEDLFERHQQAQEERHATRRAGR